MSDGMEEWPTGRLLSTAARLVEHAWTEALDELGLTHAGLIVLHLLESGPAPQGELARAARVEAQTMSRTIERLERQGFIERRGDPGDRRRRVVASTEAGRVVFQRARSVEGDVFPPLVDESAFRAVLLDIIRASAGSRWAAPAGSAPRPSAVTEASRSVS